MDLSILLSLCTTSNEFLPCLSLFGFHSSSFLWFWHSMFESVWIPFFFVSLMLTFNVWVCLDSILLHFSDADIQCLSLFGFHSSSFLWFWHSMFESVWIPFFFISLMLTFNVWVCLDSILLHFSDSDLQCLSLFGFHSFSFLWFWHSISFENIVKLLFFKIVSLSRFSDSDFQSHLKIVKVYFFKLCLCPVSLILTFNLIWKKLCLCPVSLILTFNLIWKYSKLCLWPVSLILTFNLICKILFLKIVSLSCFSDSDFQSHLIIGKLCHCPVSLILTFNLIWK